MNIQIIPKRLTGTIDIPPCKSLAHRILIAQFLSGLPCSVSAVSADIAATMRCLTVLQQWQSVNSLTDTRELPVLDCGESASTLRFLIPLTLVLCGGGIFTGQECLMHRPLTPYFDLFDRHGITYRLENQTLMVRGNLTPGQFQLRGDISSQFVTGMLFALPLLDSPSVLELITPAVSESYINLTLSILCQSGISVTGNGGRFEIPGGQRYTLKNQPIDGDWSQGAFWYAANFLGNHIQIHGLSPDSMQGDRIIKTLYQQLQQNGDREISLSDCPDLLTPLAVMASLRHGVTCLIHAGHLRLKESDRLRTTAQMLHTFGIAAEEGPDFLRVTGMGTLQNRPAPQNAVLYENVSQNAVLHGGIVDGANDHRIVMAGAVLAAACTKPVIIRDAEAVKKSYPDFWNHYQQLGGEIDVL